MSRRANSASNVLEDIKSGSGFLHRSSSNLIDSEPIWRRRGSGEFRVKAASVNVPPLPVNLMRPATVKINTERASAHYENHSLGNNQKKSAASGGQRGKTNFGASRSIVHDGSYLLWITPVAAR